MTDNGSSFNSRELKKFCEDWGINNHTSSSHFARSNGLAERCIQTVKNLWRKCLESGTDPYISLLQYRTTYRNKFPSPSELLMMIYLPYRDFVPKIVDSGQIRDLFAEKQRKSAQFYNIGARKLKPVEIGERIYFKRNPSSAWFPGRIYDRSR